MEKNMTSVSNGSSLGEYPETASIVYGIQASFSFIANLLVVVLFTCRKRLLSIPHNRCILSLAITDILTSISVLMSFILDEQAYDPETHNYLTRELYCRVIWSKFLPFALGVTSLYISVVLSLERWLAVRRSIFYKSRFRNRHMNALILLAWFVGFTAEASIIVLIEGVYEDPTKNCRHVFGKNKKLAISLSTGLFLFQTVIPLALIIAAYIDVFRGIKASLQFSASARADNVNCIKKLKKVTKVAAITTFVLVVCWLPCSIYFYYTLLKYEPRIEEYRNPFLVIVGLLAFTNGCINPCIYVFSIPELRNALKEILLKNIHTESACMRSM